MTEKEDLRVTKTRMNIEKTFVRMLESMPFDKITVRGIVAAALVNKDTFYRHYQDKYDLAEKAFARVQDQARSGIRARVEGIASRVPLATLLESFQSELSQLMPEVVAFRSVPLRNGSVELQMERLFAEEFSRATVRWGASPIGRDAPDWVVSNLAMGYLRHCWETGEASDPVAYLREVHEVSGLYLSQVRRD